MRKQFIHISLFTLLLVIVSCERRTPWEREEVDEEIIAIDALITNEYKPQTVKIMRVTANGEQAPVTSAHVRFFYEDEYMNAVEVVDEPGLYMTDSVAAEDTGWYLLTVNYDGQRYSAVARSNSISEVRPFEYEEAIDSLYRINHVTTNYNIEQSMHQISLDWSHVAGYENLDDNENHAFLKYYAFNKIDVSTITAPSKEQVLFPRGTKAVHRKYSLTEDHSNYLRAVLSETEWRGGLFDQHAAPIPSNFSNGAVGYFAVCLVDEISFTIMGDSILIDTLSH